jgi:hypothetical protein
MSTKLNKDLLAERLGQAIKDEGEVETPPWSPSLTPTQQEMFDSSALYILAYGERGTGKTYILGGHKLVRHLWENFNALGVLIVGIKSQATMGGVWHKLKTEILPLWEDGIGMHVAGERQDAQKNLYIEVSNRFGGTSQVYLVSAPYGSFIKDRIKGFEPSYVFVDELTNLDTDDYFNAVVQQLGRRPGIDSPMQYTAACNPDGPSHWVYKRFFKTPLRDGKYNEDYFVRHLRIEDNKDNLPAGYYDRIMEAISDDPIEEARMVRGEWVDRPAGNAIYKPYFVEGVHSKAEYHPSTKFPIICGWDPGSVNNAMIFMQSIVMGGKSVWLVFDEIIHNEEHIPYTQLVVEVFRRMKYWNQKLDHEFKYIHISDNSAFNQYRAKTGSYDVRDIEEISREKLESFREYNLEAIKLKAAPKFNGSVETRIRLLIAKLQNEEFLLSNKCTYLKKMFFGLVSENTSGSFDPMKSFKPKRNQYVHSHDAMTYPILYYHAGPGAIQTTKSEIIEINA